MEGIIQKKFKTSTELYNYLDTLPTEVNGIPILKPVFYCINCNIVMTTDSQFLTFMIQNLPREDPRELIEIKCKCCKEPNVRYLTRSGDDTVDNFLPYKPHTLFIIDGDVLYSEIVASQVIGDE